MIQQRKAFLALALLALAAPAASAQPPFLWPDLRKAPTGKMPMSGLTPARLLPNQCSLSYRISTSSPECQAFFDQGLGYYYSYVWMESSRSMETACKHDPDCAMAWLGLNRALERYGKPAIEALKKAHALMSKASHREQLLIQARLEEKGMWPNVGDAEARKKAAIKTLDTLLALYDDDEEGWYSRAQLGGGSGLFGGQVSAVPFYKALLQVNPLHPGANHELVHFYENMRRPALGWPYAEKYIESSPGIPHSWHMQAHLATRLGRWDKTTDRSVKAIELERAYHKEMKVKPSEDHQYSHQVETLMRGLIHDGRFAEARKLKAESQKENLRHTQVWFQLHLAERDWPAALQMARDERRKDKIGGCYNLALIYLRKNDPARAAAEVAVLQEAFQTKRFDRRLELQLWEVLGMLECQLGHPESGLKLLAKAVARVKDDYMYHAWGNGSYHMEIWGLAALGCRMYDIAEEAFLEALAHDPGCVHAALGLQVMCERLGRSEEAARYSQLAQRCWRHAAPSDLLGELEILRTQTQWVAEAEAR
jgi:tetratricopeptide (TPR) repeat protein